MPDSVRYNEVRQKSIHNTFQRHEGLADQFLYWRIRSLEVDIHRADVFGDSTKGDWAVYHSWHDPMSTIAKFSQFLQICRGLHGVVPKHEVTTLFVDIKDPFPARSDANQSWRDFDALLEEHLGPWLFRPRDLLVTARGAASLRAAIDKRAWPSLDRLRGKFIVVLTGSNEQLGNYARSSGSALLRSAFLSKPVYGPGDIPGDGDEIFFNINFEDRMHLVDRVHPLGYVARTYYVNKPHQWDQAIAADCHHIATDKVNERVDPHFSTINRVGYPFQRLDSEPIDVPEAGATCGIWARSGDIWSNSDSFRFHYNKHTTRTIDNSYEFAIASPNSHTEHFVKGAVMARSGLAPDDPYFAVVRPGSKHGLRAQFRPAKGDPTTATVPRIGPSGLFGDDIDQDTIVHVRLKIDRLGTRARAWGSFDRRSWRQLGLFTFDEPLRYQGIGVSSHGQRRGAKFLFFSPNSDANSRFSEAATIGPGGADQTGWHDWGGPPCWLTNGFSSHRPN